MKDSDWTGKHIRDKTAGDIWLIVDIIKNSNDGDLYICQLVDSGDSSYSVIGMLHEFTISSIKFQCELYPKYDTPLWKAINGGS